MLLGGIALNRGAVLGGGGATVQHERGTKLCGKVRQSKEKVMWKSKAR